MAARKSLGFDWTVARLLKIWCTGCTVSSGQVALALAYCLQWVLVPITVFSAHNDHDWI